MSALYTEAEAAIRVGDHAAAITAATLALLLLGTSPDLERSLGSGENRIGWRDSSAIEAFIDSTRKANKAVTVGASGVFAQSKVTYARPSDG